MEPEQLKEQLVSLGKAYEKLAEQAYVQYLRISFLRGDNKYLESKFQLLHKDNEILRGYLQDSVRLPRWVLWIRGRWRRLRAYWDDWQQDRRWYRDEYDEADKEE